MVVIGFDFGIKYIGVAVGQFITKTAVPVASIFVKNNLIDWNVIASFIYNWEPDCLVVGYPLGFERKNVFFCNKLEIFINNLKNKYSMPVYIIDEELSTWEAKKTYTFFERKCSFEYYSKLNATVAAILVERWFLGSSF
ncbi:MAG TPA: Holliday junction resolvase RuvX [Candidatus Azoamicus sp. OHIO1]